MRLLWTIIYVFICSIAPAQVLSSKKLHQSKITLQKVERISVDRLGGFYLSSACGLEKFDPEGHEKEKYRFSKCTATELLEAWNLFRIYGFQRATRSFKIYDQYLTVNEEIKIDSAFAIEPLLATPSNDNRSYWILDVDYSLKKIDLYNKKVIFETESVFNPNKKYNFIHAREFQNFLFLLDEAEGIFVLNNVGRFVKKIDAKGANYFSVLGEDIYFLKDNKVHFFDIYTEETYSVDVPAYTKFVVATDERLVLIKDKLIEVYAFTPKQ